MHKVKAVPRGYVALDKGVRGFPNLPVHPSCHTGAMKKTLPLVLGGLMLVIGALWTFQGLGYLEGSPMSGVEVWAVIGPIVAGFGLALVIVGFRGPR